MLRGTVEIPASKSYAHRLLIAAALADAPTRIGLNATNADIAATAACLRALGARIEPVGDGLRVQPIAAERRFQRGAEGGAEVAGTEAGADETKTVGAQCLDRADRKGAEVSADEAKNGRLLRAAVRRDRRKRGSCWIAAKAVPRCASCCPWQRRSARRVRSPVRAGCPSAPTRC